MLDFGIFAAISVGSLAVLRLVADLWKPGRGSIRRRLAGEFNDGATAVANPLYKNVGQWDDDLSAADGQAVAAPPKVSLRQQVEVYLLQSGVPLSVRQLAWLCGGTAAALGLAGLFVGGWLPPVAGLVVGAAGPVGFVAAKRKARREKYVKQLAGAFELMARVLKAGQSVPEAFRAATEAFDDPLRGEFTRCLHQIEHGLRPEAAYRDLSQRSGVIELRIFVIAMTVQRQSGGNLSEVLERLGTLVRGRDRQRMRLRGLTAEGRMQSLTLIVLPFVTFAAMYLLNRPYAEILLVQWKLLLATGALMGVGIVWIRSIMNFEG